MTSYGSYPCPACKINIVERKKPKGAIPRCGTCLSSSVRGRLDRQNLKRKNGFDAHRNSSGIRYGSVLVLCFYCKEPFINTRQGAVTKYCASCATRHEAELEKRRLELKSSDRQKTLANRARWRRKLRRVGLSLDELEEKGLQCGICGSKSPGKKGWCLDHDHGCCSEGCSKCVRGILCGICNLGLGLFKDDPVRLESAIAWIVKHRI